MPTIQEQFDAWKATEPKGSVHMLVRRLLESIATMEEDDLDAQIADLNHFSDGSDPALDRLLANACTERLAMITRRREGVRFPDVRVQLSGRDGNAMFIIARVRRALLDAGYKEGAEEFVKQAESGDYDNVLRTCMEFVDVE